MSDNSELEKCCNDIVYFAENYYTINGNPLTSDKLEEIMTYPDRQFIIFPRRLSESKRLRKISFCFNEMVENFIADLQDPNLIGTA